LPSSSKVPIWDSAGAIVVSDKVGYCFRKRIRMDGGSAQKGRQSAAAERISGSERCNPSDEQVLGKVDRRRFR
jgi:hypothetical protein